MAESVMNNTKGERGMALVTALMVTTMLMTLGIALAFSTSTDTVTTKSHRIGEQAFYAADTGLAISRRALMTALSEEIDKIKKGTAGYGTNGFYSNVPSLIPGGFPTVQVIPDPDQVPNYQFYTNVYNRAKQLAAAANPTTTDANAKLTTTFTPVFRPLSGSVTLDVDKTDPTVAMQVIKFRYSIQVTGTTSAGGSATVNETGRILINLSLDNTAVPGLNRNFSFSGFGAFFDNGDTAATSALAGGTFSGPVHTNTHFAFQSSRNVSFRNRVSQVDSYIRYDSSSFTQGQRSIPSTDITGIDISSEGYKKVDRVPLPSNTFSQEYAVINGTGITDKNADGTPVDPPGVMPKDSNGLPLPVIDALGRVTPEALSANLRDAQNKQIPVSGGKFNGGGDGVYVSAGDGAKITGAGIYVQGDASDIQLYANGKDQVYVVKQGSKTTTIVVSPTNNTTRISDSSGKSATFTGVPTDKSDPVNPKPGVSLYVTGNINSLRGGFDSTTGKNVAALASGTRLTITAGRDITITGDLKYSDPVVDSQGLPVTNFSAVQNVLGIFTNDGNVNLAPNSNYNAATNLSLDVNAAIVSFNSNASNDNGEIEGSITYTGSSTPGSNDKWTLMGSRVQSKINNIGYSNRSIFFDVRFSGGGFRPPFFPGTTYDLGAPEAAGEVVITNVSDAKSVGSSWYRESN
jgi:hypothetical protein